MIQDRKKQSKKKSPAGEEGKKLSFYFVRALRQGGRDSLPSSFLFRSIKSQKGEKEEKSNCAPFTLFRIAAIRFPLLCRKGGWRAFFIPQIFGQVISTKMSYFLPLLALF